MCEICTDQKHASEKTNNATKQIIKGEELMKKELKKEVLVTENEDKEASGMELKTIDISLIMTSKHNLRTDPC